MNAHSAWRYRGPGLERQRAASGTSRIALELLRPGSSEPEQALPGLDPRDRPLAGSKIGAVGITELDPQALRVAQPVAPPGGQRAHELLVGEVKSAVPDRGLGGEALHDLGGRIGVVAVFLGRRLGGERRRRQDQDERNHGWRFHRWCSPTSSEEGGPHWLTAVN